MRDREKGSDCDGFELQSDECRAFRRAGRDGPPLRGAAPARERRAAHSQPSAVPARVPAEPGPEADVRQSRVQVLPLQSGTVRASTVVMGAVSSSPLEPGWKDLLSLSMRRAPDFYEGSADIDNVPYAGSLRTAFDDLGVSAVLCVQHVPTVVIVSANEYDPTGVVSLHAADHRGGCLRRRPGPARSRRPGRLSGRLRRLPNAIPGALQDQRHISPRDDGGSRWHQLSDPPAR